MAKKEKYILSSSDLKNSAIFTVCISILLWIIKAIYHCYWMGKFSFYHIEKSYIEINSDNTILDILYFMLGIIVIGLCNYFHDNIVKKSSNNEKWKRIIGIIGFYLIQALLVFMFIIVYSNVSVYELWNETTIKQILIVFISSIFLCVIINIYSILGVTPRDYKSIIEKKSFKNIKLSIVVIIIACLMVGLFALGRHYEQEKTGYKILIEDSIEIKKDGNEIYFYPVVYENKDYYILSKFSYNKKKFIYEYQKIIRKDGQATLYIQDIYNFNIED